MKGRAALVAPSEFDRSEARLSCYGRNSCADIGVVARDAAMTDNAPHNMQADVASAQGLAKGRYRGPAQSRDNRRAQSAMISVSQSERCGLLGCVRLLGIRPIRFRNTAAECL